MKRFLKNIWVWLFVVLIVAGVANRNLDSRSETESRVDLSPNISAGKSYALSQNAIVEIEGGVVRVSAPLTGTIKSVLVSEGDKVVKGQLLALQEDRDDLIALELAKVAVDSELLKQKSTKLNLNIAKRKLERLEFQRRQDAVPQQSVDNQRDVLLAMELAIETNANSMKRMTTQIENARYRLSQRRVVAPVDGRILETAVTAGAGVSAENTSTAFSIIPDAPKYLLARVREQDIGSVFVGQVVEFTLDYRSEERYMGVVKQIGSVFSNANSGRNSRENSVDVVIQADDIPFRIGRTVLVQFHNTNDQSE